MSPSEHAQTDLALWLSPEDVDLLDLELGLLVNRAEPGTERHTRLVGLRNRLHWTEQDGREVQQDQASRQAAMERVIEAAWGVADSFHAIGADRMGRVHWEVDPMKMRALHIALAGCRALDATEQEGRDGD